MKPCSGTLAHALLGSRAHYASLWANRERLAAIPALVLWGERDRAFNVEFLERFRQALPRAKIEGFADAGHWPHEERPELVFRALQRFFDEHDAERGK